LGKQSERKKGAHHRARCYGTDSHIGSLNLD
jgi:hypothetical protein